MLIFLFKVLVGMLLIFGIICVFSIICFIGSCVAENMREEREKSPENQRIKAMVDD